MTSETAAPSLQGCAIIELTIKQLKRGVARYLRRLIDGDTRTR